jgi:hypothetical protein
LGSATATRAGAPFATDAPRASAASYDHDLCDLNQRLDLSLNSVDGGFDPEPVGANSLAQCEGSSDQVLRHAQDKKQHVDFVRGELVEP